MGRIGEQQKMMNELIDFMEENSMYRMKTEQALRGYEITVLVEKLEDNVEYEEVETDAE